MLWRQRDCGGDGQAKSMEEDLNVKRLSPSGSERKVSASRHTKGPPSGVRARFLMPVGDIKVK